MTPLNQQITELLLSKRPFINKEGLEFHLTGQVVCISLILQKGQETETSYVLYDEIHGIDRFIELFRLSSLTDIHLIGRSQLWVRYLQEFAEMIYTNMDQHTIHFRKLRDKTMVYSIDLNYYNEVYKVLNMTEHFEGFIEEHQEELEGLSYKV